VTGKNFPILYLSFLLVVVSACATQSYHHESTGSFPIRERAVIQNEGNIRISVSVPDADEAKKIFGVPVYKRGIQPVWLEIVNNGPERLRFAPTSLDPVYFSPLEVAYMHRKGFSKEARAQMDRRFHDSAMPRQIRDDRGRFREIYCAVLDDHGQELPDYRSCETALTRVGTKPEPSGQEINLGASRQNYLVAIVPGFGWECFEGWLQSENSVSNHLATFGYEVIQLKVDGLSGTENNARQINEQIASLPADKAGKPLILLGYSKGTPDILQAVVDYPELAEKVVEVISAAGAVGGSALANRAKQSQANILTKIPQSDCSEGDGGAVADMRPAIRKKWLAENTLPQNGKN